MDRMFAHLNYLQDNPPIGGLYKQYLEARYGTGNKKNKHLNNHPKKMNKKEKTLAEKNALHSLCADFHVDINSLQKKPKRRLIKV